MSRTTVSIAAALAMISVTGAGTADAQTVKVTPLGSAEGEFCALDRAMIFEDPDGTRLLYDPGRTVAGPEDPRLGEIDAILISHVHGDHVGDRHSETTQAGGCAEAEYPVDATPVTNLVKIAVEKESTIVSGSDMPPFFAAKLKEAGGDPSKSVLVRFGAMTDIGGVGVATVPADHSNGVPGSLIGGELGEMIDAAGVKLSVGLSTGFILEFTNGLVVWLSGDTGIMADQKLVIGNYYAPQLAVMNIGDTYTTGPEEGAYVINELVQPNAVIPSHVNENATSDGEPAAGSRTATFVEAVNVPAHLPLSGATMAFDESGTCVEGC